MESGNLVKLPIQEVAAVALKSECETAVTGFQSILFLQIYKRAIKQGMAENNPKRMKVKAGVLMVVLVISLFIAVVSTLFILLAFNSQRLGISLIQSEKLDRNLKSAINWVLSDSSVVARNGNKSLDLFNSGNDSVFLRDETWGIFQVETVKVRDQLDVESKSFYKGSPLSKQFDGCLYLADHRRPLAVSGMTLVTGRALVPKAGVIPAYLDSNGYALKSLINGSIGISTEMLPMLDSGMISYLYTLKERYIFGHTTLAGKGFSDSLNVSFSDNAEVIYQKGAILLAGGNFSGHIIIVSDSCIEVTSSSVLSNIILVAPVIRFQKGFSGLVQAIAQDSLVVENNCQFLYPSSLILMKAEGDRRQPQVCIGSNVSVQGVILAYAKEHDKNKTYVKLGNFSSVIGLTYVCGYLEDLGMINGLVCTDFFIFKSSTTTYENYLVNAVVDGAHLTSFFLLPNIFKPVENNRIAQWVK